MSEEESWVEFIAHTLEARFGTHALNAAEFGSYLGMSPTMVGRRIRRGELPGVSFGSGSYLIPVDSIAIWEVQLSKAEAEK